MTISRNEARLAVKVVHLENRIKLIEKLVRKYFRLDSRELHFLTSLETIETAKELMRTVRFKG